MKILAILMVLGMFNGFVVSAQASHWECIGRRDLKKISFDWKYGIENFSVVAPDFDEAELRNAFRQVNDFTLTAVQLIDIHAQETIDYTLILDRRAETLTVLSQWSTNHHVDSETMSCAVSKE